LSFKKHESVGLDGKARYPLPAEGQPANLPLLLGGTSNNDWEDRPRTSAKKCWDEGWYLWAGQGRWSVLQKTDMMMLDLQKQKQAELKRERRKELWHDYQAHLKHGLGGVADQPQSGQWGPIVPPKPIPDTRYVETYCDMDCNFDDVRSSSSLSLLVRLPPDFPSIFEKIDKYLQPTYRVLSILRESFASGEQKEFALRVWEKAKSDAPFILARRTIEHAYEQWKKWDVKDDKDDKDNGRKDST
jgi:hypothetical protein